MLIEAGEEPDEFATMRPLGQSIDFSANEPARYSKAADELLNLLRQLQAGYWPKLKLAPVMPANRAKNKYWHSDLTSANSVRIIEVDE